MSEDFYITKDDVFGYLDERDPDSFDDAELMYCYDMMENHFSRYLETEDDDTDLHLAKYWLQSAWIVEDERDK